MDNIIAFPGSGEDSAEPIEMKISATSEQMITQSLGLALQNKAAIEAAVILLADVLEVLSDVDPKETIEKYRQLRNQLTSSFFQELQERFPPAGT